MKHKIVVVGMGYVGLANAVLLAQYNSVTAIEIEKKKLRMINAKQSPIADAEIEQFLHDRVLNLYATDEAAKAYRTAEFVVICTPTNYDTEKNSFDTSSVEQVIKEVHMVSPETVIVIKSTVPVGFTRKVAAATNHTNMLFAPEFLREGRALYDNLYPSRIIVGYDHNNSELKKAAEVFADLMRGGCTKKRAGSDLHRHHGS